MIVRTTRFGRLEAVDVPEGALLSFPDGLPGFEQHHEFALVEDERYAPFCWLQALNDPEVRFLLIDAALLVPGYDARPNPLERVQLGLGQDGETRVLSIITIADDIREMTANLRAPLLVNPQARLGRQIILADDCYGLREPVLRPAAEPAVPRTLAC